MAIAILGILALSVVGIGCQTTEVTSSTKNETLAVEQQAATNAAPVMRSWPGKPCRPA